MLTDGLFSLLAGAPSIVAILGAPNTRTNAKTGIWPVQMPEGEETPAIVFAQIPSGPTLMTLDGPDPFRIVRMQFSCYGKTYESSKQLARAVRNLLDGYTGTFADGTPVQSMRTMLETDTFEDAPFVYHTPIDVEIQFEDVGS